MVGTTEDDMDKDAGGSERHQTPQPLGRMWLATCKTALVTTTQLSHLLAVCALDERKQAWEQRLDMQG